MFLFYVFLRCFCSKILYEKEMCVKKHFGWSAVRRWANEAAKKGGYRRENEKKKNLIINHMAQKSTKRVSAQCLEYFTLFLPRKKCAWRERIPPVNYLCRSGILDDRNETAQDDTEIEKNGNKFKKIKWVEQYDKERQQKIFFLIKNIVLDQNFQNFWRYFQKIWNFGKKFQTFAKHFKLLQNILNFCKQFQTFAKNSKF